MSKVIRARVRKNWLRLLGNFDQLLLLIDVAIFVLIFFWVFQLMFFVLQSFVKLPSTAYPATSSDLINLSNFILYSVPVTLVAGILLASLFSRYRKNVMVSYARLSGLRRWQSLSWGCLGVFGILLAIGPLTQVGVIPSSSNQVASDYTVGALSPFIDWMILYFAAYASEAPDQVYGQLAYLEILGKLDETRQFQDSRRIRTLLLGTYGIVSKSFKRDLMGIEKIELDRFFTRMQLAAVGGNARQRRLVSEFASNTFELFTSKDPNHRRPGRLLELVDKTNTLLSTVDSGAVTSSIEIRWPGRFLRPSHAIGSFARLLIELVVAVAVALLNRVGK